MRDGRWGVSESNRLSALKDEGNSTGLCAAGCSPRTVCYKDILRIKSPIKAPSCDRKYRTAGPNIHDSVLPDHVPRAQSCTFLSQTSTTKPSRWLNLGISPKASFRPLESVEYLGKGQELKHSKGSASGVLRALLSNQAPLVEDSAVIDASVQVRFQVGKVDVKSNFNGQFAFPSPKSSDTWGGRLPGQRGHIHNLWAFLDAVSRC